VLSVSFVASFRAPLTGVLAGCQDGRVAPLSSFLLASVPPMTTQSSCNEDSDGDWCAPSLPVGVKLTPLPDKQTKQTTACRPQPSASFTSVSSSDLCVLSVQPAIVPVSQRFVCMPSLYV
jgi:hypothetical protein